MQQMGGVTPVAGVNLLPCMENGGVRLGGILQFDDAQGHTIDEEQNIGTAVFGLAVVGVLHGELIDGPENVVLRLLKIDQGDHPGQSAPGCEGDAVHHPAVNLVQSRKLVVRANETDSVKNLLNLFGVEVGIGLAQKLHKIIGIQNLTLGTAGNAAASQVMPALVLQEGQEGILKILLAEAAIVVFQFWHVITSYRNCRDHSIHHHDNHQIRPNLLRLKHTLDRISRLFLLSFV